MPKQTKVIIKRKKFQEVDVPIIKGKIEVIGNSLDELKNKTIKLDLTRQLKGKNIEAVFKINIINNKAVTYPIKIKLMPYFIRRMIRKKISYVEDSFKVKSQESLLTIKPFLITRKRVSRAVRKALRNRARNWIEDYISQKKDEEIFNGIFSNTLQKPLSLVLKKTYPLSLCEIRILEIERPLEKKEIPEIVSKKIEKAETFIDQIKEIEEERIREAEEEIKKTQLEAVKKDEKEEKTEEELETTKNKETKDKKLKKEKKTKASKKKTEEDKKTE